MDYNHISHIWLITGQQIQLGGHLQMKRKLIIALAAAMTITLGSVGVVSADDTNFAPFIPVKETPIRDGFVWIVDTPAWTETINHPEEGHYENGKLLEEEQGHYETVVDKEAWAEDKWVVDKEAWTETINHPEEGHYETVVDKEAWTETQLVTVCNNCGTILTSETDIVNHYTPENMMNGCSSYGNKEITIEHPAETHEEWVVDKEAWTETINHPEEGHMEHIEHPAETHEEWVVDKPAVYEQVWKVDKEAWTETVEHPEVGHWEPIPENPDEQEPETPQNPDEQEPETPQNPDEQEPETPQNPDEQEPETPQNPDEQNPETPDNNQNNNENNNQNENNSQNNNENTSHNNNSSETSTSQDDSTGKQPPKTGDPTSFASLYALAGSALAGIGAVKLKFRKRK